MVFGCFLGGWEIGGWGVAGGKNWVSFEFESEFRAAAEFLPTALPPRYFAAAFDFRAEKVSCARKKFRRFVDVVAIEPATPPEAPGTPSSSYVCVGVC